MGGQVAPPPPGRWRVKFVLYSSCKIRYILLSSAATTTYIQPSPTSSNIASSSAVVPTNPGVITFTAEVTVEERCDAALKDPNSEKYQNLSSTIGQAIDEVFVSHEGYLGTNVTGFRCGNTSALNASTSTIPSTEVEFEVKFKDTTKKNKSSIVNILKDDIVAKNGTLGGINADPRSVKVGVVLSLKFSTYM